MSNPSTPGRRIRLGMVGGGKGPLLVQFTASPPGLMIAMNWSRVHFRPNPMSLPRPQQNCSSRLIAAMAVSKPWHGLKPTVKTALMFARL